MYLNDLLENIEGYDNHLVEYITDDSRKCTFNSIFVLLEENLIKAINYSNQAINLKAKTIITSLDLKLDCKINIIKVDNPSLTLAKLLSKFYDISDIKLIGVIGTNGKTTTSNLIYNYLNYLNIDCAYIGTNGCNIKDLYFNHENTTPKITILYEYLNKCKSLNVKYVVMEISSISVDLNRIKYLNFYILSFLNFESDHLDYHKTLENYYLCKCLPFYKLTNNSYAILNKDDINVMKIVKYLDCPYLSLSLNNTADINANIISRHNNGIDFCVDNNLYFSNMLGDFNVYNTLNIFAISKILNISYNHIYSFLKDYNLDFGRMQQINYKGYHIIIDYAHTQSAVKNAIDALKQINKIGRNFVIVGCGGNRDKTKRYKIGSILSDDDILAIVTTDNPRYENKEDIINDILKGSIKPLIAIKDRKLAIEYAISNMTKNDYLLILGKGIEEYIIENGIKYPHSDISCVKSAVDEYGK